MKDQLRTFIRENYFVPDLEPIADSDSLLEAGIVDSTGVLELVEFLENAFGLTIADREIVPANLDSIDHIVTFIRRKQLESTKQPEGRVERAL